MKPLRQYIWKNYGLKANPFDTRALSLGTKSSLPIAQAFVGRDHNSRESTFVTNILSNPGGTCFVVEGAVGVGKTTFVNYHRDLWEREAEDKILTPEEEISVCDNWTAKDFLLNILETIIERITKLPSGEKYIQADSTLEEIYLLSRIYKNRIPNLGLNLYHVGASWGENETLNIPSMPEIKLLRYFRYLVQKIKEFGYSGLFLHLDNLELLRPSGVEKAQALFENLRDTLQTPNVYFAIVGYRGFFHEIIAPRERLKSIFFGRPILIHPLSKNEVQAVIERRYSLLKMQAVTLIPPFDIEFIDYLYDIYRGKIRFIMEAINTLVPFLSKTFPTTISSEKARIKLKEILTEELMESVTPQEYEILKAGMQQDYFTNNDICKAIKISAPNVTRALKKLQQNGLISYMRKEGRNLFYQVHEDVRIVLDRGQVALVSKYQSQSFSNTKKRAQKVLKSFSATTFTSVDYAQMAQVSIATARKDLKYLVENGIVIKKGTTKGTHYSMSDRV